VFNAGNTRLYVTATYFGERRVAARVVHAVTPHGVLAIDVRADIGAAAGKGALGGELAVEPGKNGSFVACAVGLSADGKVALEECGRPP
jgi:hypothetical protein